MKVSKRGEEGGRGEGGRVKCILERKKNTRKWEEKKEGKKATRMGFEPTRAEHNGLAVHRLNHSATSSVEVARAKNVILLHVFK